jgi:outer membrane protein assembly factor BamB
VRQWDGGIVEDLPAFMNRVASSRPGTTIAVQVVRRGRTVMERFRAGRRPVGHGRMLDYGAQWVEPDGRVLLPGRTGLAWLDPRAGTRVPLWRWAERGVVRRARAAAGRAFVTVQRGPYPDLVVAVDTTSGRELWRREVRGTVAWTEPAGSGLWIQAANPAQALLVDAADGRPRGAWRCFDVRRHEFRKTWSDAESAAVAAGRGYVVTGVPDAHVLHVVNTSTAAIEFADAWSDRTGSGGYDGYANPQVDAGAYVAVVRAPGLRLYFPDPLGGSPRHVVDVDGRVLMSSQSHYGPLDSDTRIAVRGSTLYVVRVPARGRRNVSASVFGVSYEALGEPAMTPAVPGGGAVYMRTSQIWMSGNALPTRYVVDVQPSFEGVLVAAAQLADDHAGETWWVSAMDEDDVDENRHVRLLEADMHDARRYAPVRNGDTLLVPTDRGALCFPVRTYGE